MQKYESLFIFNPGLEEDKLKKKIEEVKKYVISKKGKVENIKETGRVNLAYPIKKCLEGINVVLDLEISPEVVDKFKNKFVFDGLIFIISKKLLLYDNEEVIEDKVARSYLLNKYLVMKFKKKCS